MQSDLEALRGTDMFASLPDEHLAQLAMRCQHRRFEAGARIFKAGDPGTTLFVITDGRVQIETVADNGKEIMLAELENGDAFGDLALLDGLPRSASAIAMVGTDCITLHRDDFLELVESSSDAMRAVLTALSRIIRTMNERLVEVATHSYADRLAKELRRLANEHGVETSEGVLIDRPLSRSQLARRVGIYQGEVESLMAHLEYERIVMVVGDRVTVVRPDRLAEA